MRTSALLSRAYWFVPTLLPAPVASTQQTCSTLPNNAIIRTTPIPTYRDNKTQFDKRGMLLLVHNSRTGANMIVQNLRWLAASPSKWSTMAITA